MNAVEPEGSLPSSHQPAESPPEPGLAPARKATTVTAMPTSNRAPPSPVDMEALSRLTAGDATFRLDLIETFIEVGGCQLQDIERALKLDDIAVIARAAQKLKANSGYLFAAEVSRCAAKLEAATQVIPERTDAREPTLAALAHELRCEFTRAVEFLRAATE
jgi:HPt (histidine-containing phosphotransfer) domain-containing protein